MPISTHSLWRPESRPHTDLPESTQVLVIGAGLTGLAVAQRLMAKSVDVHVIEAKPEVGGGMASRGMGIASVLLLDPPFRLIHAVGSDAAKDILRFSAEGVARWGNAIEQTGVVYATKGAAESSEVHQNLEAMAALGIEAEPDAKVPCVCGAGVGGCGVGRRSQHPGASEHPGCSVAAA